MTPNMNYQSAQLNLEALRHELYKTGLDEDLSRLQAIEVTCPGSAAVALEIVKNLPMKNGHTPQNVREVQAWTIERLEAALGTKRVA